MLADKALTALQKKKESNTSWQVKQRKETQPKEIDGTPVWITTYRKSAIKGTGDETLCLFVDVLDDFIAANQTGKLAIRISPSYPTI